MVPVQPGWVQRPVATAGGGPTVLTGIVPTADAAFWAGAAAGVAVAAEGPGLPQTSHQPSTIVPVQPGWVQAGPTVVAVIAPPGRRGRSRRGSRAARPARRGSAGRPAPRGPSCTRGSGRGP